MLLQSRLLIRLALARIWNSLARAESGCRTAERLTAFFQLSLHNQPAFQNILVKLLKPDIYVERTSLKE